MRAYLRERLPLEFIPAKFVLIKQLPLTETGKIDRSMLPEPEWTPEETHDNSVAPRNLAVTVPAGLASGATSMKIRYQGPIAAPIAKGQHVADLVITTTDTPPQIVPLVAGEDVGRAGFFGRIWLGLKSLFGMA